MKKEEEVKVPTVEEVKEPETPKEELTAEQILEGEKTKVVKLEEEVGKLNIGLARKEGEVKRLREQQPPPPPTMNRAYQIMLEDMKARQTDFGEGNPRIAELESLITEERRKEDTVKQRQAMEAVTLEARTKLDTRIKEAGFDPEEEMFDDVNEAFDIAYAVDGKFERAEKKLTRILGKAKPKETVKGDEDFEKRVEEEIRKRNKEAGLLTTETGGPSASSGSWVEFEKEYIAGNVSKDDYEARGRKEGKIQ